MKKILVLLLIGLPALFYPSAGISEEPMGVTVSILPQKYFVEKIGGDRVKVNVLVLPGSSPHSYEPRPRQMLALKKSRIYFTIGVALEKAWLPKFRAVNPDLAVVDTHQGIERIPMESRHLHENDPKQEEEGEMDPHIWLSPPLVRIQAKNILEALVRADPQGKDLFQKNHDKFALEIASLDDELKKILAPEKDAAFLVFHPAWGYFARDYGLKQISVEMEGKNPGPKDLQHIIELARERNIKVVFAQPQVSPRIAETIAGAIRGQVALIDPLSGDWAGNLKQAAEKFKSALK